MARPCGHAAVNNPRGQAEAELERPAHARQEGLPHCAKTEGLYLEVVKRSH